MATYKARTTGHENLAHQKSVVFPCYGCESTRSVNRMVVIGVRAVSAMAPLWRRVGYHDLSGV